MNKTESICVYDFNGTAKYLGYYEPVSMWADYYPKIQKTLFGGAWHDVPELSTPNEPTEGQVENHAKLYSQWEKESKERREKDKLFLENLRKPKKNA